MSLDLRKQRLVGGATQGGAPFLGRDISHDDGHGDLLGTVDRTVLA